MYNRDTNKRGKNKMSINLKDFKKGSKLQANELIEEFLMNDNFEEDLEYNEDTLKLALITYLKDYQEIETLKEEEYNKLETWFNHENFKGFNYDSLEEFINHFEEILKGYSNDR
jgi:hypothetical protein